MPVVINEIVITANVSEQTTGSRNGQVATQGAALPPKQMETIVRLCVEEVMRLLKEKEER